MTSQGKIWSVTLCQDALIGEYERKGMCIWLRSMPTVQTDSPLGRSGRRLKFILGGMGWERWKGVSLWMNIRLKSTATCMVYSAGETVSFLFVSTIQSIGSQEDPPRLSQSSLRIFWKRVRSNQQGRVLLASWAIYSISGSLNRLAERVKFSVRSYVGIVRISAISGCLEEQSSSQSLLMTSEGPCWIHTLRRIGQLLERTLWMYSRGSMVRRCPKATPNRRRMHTNSRINIQ